MGLFGYRKKTFYKNTDTYKSRLYEIAEISLRESKFKPEESLRDVIFNLIQLLDLVSFPQKANSKVQKAIDYYIFHLIDELETAVIDNKKFLVLGLLSIMSDVISDCRRTGEFSHLAEQNFHNEEKRARYREEIESITEQKEDITRKKHEFLKEARQADLVNEHEKTETLLLEYSRLEEKEKHLEEALKSLIEAYNTLGEDFNRTIFDKKKDDIINEINSYTRIIDIEELRKDEIRLEGEIMCTDPNGSENPFEEAFKKHSSD